MVKDKPLKLILWPIVFALGLVLSLAIGGFNPSTQVNADNANAYDISEYQGYVNDNQASQLKNEVNFMILKAQNGGLYTDPQFQHNAQEMSAHNIPYGAYDYSLYANPAQAQAEAQALYQRAPQASFYVNDSEENNAGDQLNASTQAWANEIHQLTRKPAVLYSGLYFMNNNYTPQTRNAYDALWLADYGIEPSPSYHYDLWQSSDNHYSPALGQSVDASVFPEGNNKPLSFWTGNGDGNRTVKPVTHPRRNRRARHARRQVIKPQASRTTRRNQARVGNQRNRRGQKARRNRKFVKLVNRRVRRTRRNRRALNRRNNASKRIRKSRKYRRDHQKRVTRIVYNPNFYKSKRIHYLKVTAPSGIHLYNMKNQYEDGVAPGTVLNVYGFKTFYNRQLGYITKAIGTHFGQYDLFTAEKDLVQRV